MPTSVLEAYQTLTDEAQNEVNQLIFSLLSQQNNCRPDFSKQTAIDSTATVESLTGILNLDTAISMKEIRSMRLSEKYGV